MIRSNKLDPGPYKISIALCTYNGEKYILEQLQSIAAQSLLPAEIIVCDDGSTDHTVQIVKQFSDQTSIPIKIHNNGTTLGVKRNFHKAIGLCTGEFIALCDQDDVWSPDNLERKVDFLRSNKHTDVVFSDLLLVKDNLEPLSCTMWQLLEFTNSQRKKWKAGKALDVLLKRDNVVTGASIVLRASFRDKFMKYLLLEFNHWIHDALIAVTAARENTIQFIDSTPILYRQHPGQLIGSPVNFRQYSLKTRLVQIIKGKINIDKDLEQEILFRENQIVDFKKVGVSAEKIAYLEKCIKHIQRRRNILRRSKLSRLFLITKEILLRRYKKFRTTGLLDPLRDLFHKTIS